MTGPELRKARKRLFLTQVRLAQLLGINPRSVSRWEISDTHVPRYVRLIMIMLLSVPAARRHIGLDDQS